MTGAEEDEGGTAAVDSSSEPTEPASADEKPDICPLEDEYEFPKNVLHTFFTCTHVSYNLFLCYFLIECKWYVALQWLINCFLLPFSYLKMSSYD